MASVPVDFEVLYADYRDRVKTSRMWGRGYGRLIAAELCWDLDVPLETKLELEQALVERYAKEVGSRP
jgi:hypothetical protein